MTTSDTKDPLLQKNLLVNGSGGQNLNGTYIGMLEHAMYANNARKPYYGSRLL